MLRYYNNIIIIDSEIDGDAFTLLKEEDIISLVPIGAARKLISKRKIIIEVSAQENAIFTVSTAGG